MGALTPIMKSASCIKKLERPILTPADMPYDSLLVFNAGVAKYQGKYIMAFRNDYGTDPERFLREKHMPGTSVGIAVSDNGIDGWKVFEKPLCDNHELMEKTGREIKRFYDPRITVIEDKLYLCMAADCRHGIRGTVASLSDDLEHYEVLSMSTPNNRNMVLFPERIGGDYVRLERPMAMWSDDLFCFDIWLSTSPDLKYWGNSTCIADLRIIPFGNRKVGPGAPPVKTEKGWLTTFHSVDHQPNRGKNGWENSWDYRYVGGIMLLDLEDPTKILGIYKEPLIAPDMPYETDEGFRQNTIFPGGMILEDDGEVKIYYGASDAYECVCTADVNDLLKLCLEG